ncbi:MAG: hypothetical protein KJO25_06385 [Bacteroidia bacterium]|nr:hypothetical protein [Bacteroidia bacterium]NNK73186.1 hypothetical protein [Flavobacteriaceae bacterium]
MRRSIILLTLIMGLTSQVFGQFNGSNGDGFDVAEVSALSLSQSQLAIFDGGSGDGFDVEESLKHVLSGTAVAIFIGGNGDGFAVEESVKNILNGTALAIYFGGNGDGFAFEQSLKNVLGGESVSLFSGGNGDGYVHADSFKNLLDGAIVSIFSGGQGDGFASDTEVVYLIRTVKVNIIAFLQGPIIQPDSPGLMNDDLRALNFLPTTSPYADEVDVDPGIFDPGGISGGGLANDDIVDWVWIELREANSLSKIIGRRSALIQRDGNIVDIDGTSLLSITANPANYYVVVKHRNHMGIMSGNSLALSELPVQIDFSDPITSTFGSNAQLQLTTGKMALWAGDTAGNDNVRFSGSGNDANIIKDHVLGDPANVFNSVTFSSSGYLSSDADLNGTAKFSGAGNDSNILKDNVLSHPGNGFGTSTYTIDSTVPPANEN